LEEGADLRVVVLGNGMPSYIVEERCSRWLWCFGKGFCKIFASCVGVGSETLRVKQDAKLALFNINPGVLNLIRVSNGYDMC